MPRTTQEIIDHAAELAKRFEDYEPQATDRETVSPRTRLRLAALRRSEAEKEVADAVRAAKREHLSWDVIGKTLGTSGEAARQKYSRVLEDA